MNNIIQAEGDQRVLIQVPMRSECCAVAAAHLFDTKTLNHAALHSLGHGRRGLHDREALFAFGKPADDSGDASLDSIGPGPLYGDSAPAASSEVSAKVSTRGGNLNGDVVLGELALNVAGKSHV